MLGVSEYKRFFQFTCVAVTTAYLAKRMYEGYEYFFGVSYGNTPDPSLSQMSLNTKSWMYKDCLSIYNHNGSYLRKKHNIADGKVYNLNNEENTKRQFLNESKKHFVHCNIIEEFSKIQTHLNNEDIPIVLNEKFSKIQNLISKISIKEFCIRESVKNLPKVLQKYDLIDNPSAEVTKEVSQNLLKSTHDFNNKDLEIEENLNRLNDEYFDFLRQFHDLDLHGSKNESLKSIQAKVKLIFEIEKPKTLHNLKIIDHDVLNLLSIRKSVKEDLYLKYQIITFPYRMMYDLDSCSTLVNSLGHFGKTFLSSMNTRSWLMGSKSSTQFLPDSYFALMRLLDITEEDCALIKSRTCKDNEYHLNKTTLGKYLHQEISETNNKILLDNIFGTVAQGKSHHKLGMIDEVQKEIEERFNKFSLEKYFNDFKLFGGKFIQYKHDNDSLFPDIVKKWETLISLMELKKNQSQKNEASSFEAPNNGLIDKNVELIKKRATNLNELLLKIENIHSLFDLHSQSFPKDLRIKFIFEQILNLRNMHHNKIDECSHILLNINDQIEKKCIVLEDLHKAECIIFTILQKIEFFKEDSLPSKDSSLSPKATNRFEEENQIYKIFNQELDFLYSYSNILNFLDEDSTNNSIVKMSLSISQTDSNTGKIFKNIENLIDSFHYRIKDNVKTVFETDDFQFIKEALANHNSLNILLFFYNQLQTYLSDKTEGEVLEFRNNPEKLDEFTSKLFSEFLSSTNDMKESLIAVTKTFKNFLVESVKNDFLSDIHSICKVKIHYNNQNYIEKNVKDFNSENFNILIHLSSIYETLEKNIASNSSQFSLKTLSGESINISHFSHIELFIDKDNFHHIFMKKLDNHITKLNTFDVTQSFREKVFQKVNAEQKKIFQTFIESVCKEFGIDTKDSFKIIKYLQDNNDSNYLFDLLKNLNVDPPKFKKFETTALEYKNREVLNYDYKFDGNFGLGTPILNVEKQSFYGFIYENIMPMIQVAIGALKIKSNLEEQLKNKVHVQSKIVNISKEAKNILKIFINTLNYSFQEIKTIVHNVTTFHDFKQFGTEASKLSSDVCPFEELSEFHDQNKFDSYIKHITKDLHEDIHHFADQLRDMGLSNSEKDFVEILFTTKEMKTFSERFLNSKQVAKKTIYQNSNNFKIIKIESDVPYKKLLGKNNFEYIMDTLILNKLVLLTKNDVSFAHEMTEDVSNLLIEINPYLYSGFYFQGKGFSRRLIEKLEKIKSNSPSYEEISSSCQYTFDKILKQISATKKEIINKINVQNILDNKKLYNEILHIYENLYKKIGALMETNNVPINSKQMDEVIQKLLSIDDISFLNLEIHKKFLLSTKYIASGEFQDHKSNIISKIKKIFNKIHNYNLNKEIKIDNFNTFQSLFHHRLDQNHSKLSHIDYSYYYKSLSNILSDYKEYSKKLIYFDHNISLFEKTFLENYLKEKYSDIVGFEKEMDFIITILSFMEYKSDEYILNSILLSRFLSEHGITESFFKVIETLNSEGFKNKTKIKISEEKALFDEITKIQNILNSIREHSDKKMSFYKGTDFYRIYGFYFIDKVKNIFSFSETECSKDFILESMNKVVIESFSFNDLNTKDFLSNFIHKADSNISFLIDLTRDEKLKSFNTFSQHCRFLDQINSVEEFKYLEKEIQSLLSFANNFNHAKLKDSFSYINDFNYVSSYLLSQLDDEVLKLHKIEKIEFKRDEEIERGLSPDSLEEFKNIFNACEKWAKAKEYVDSHIFGEKTKYDIDPIENSDEFNKVNEEMFDDLLKFYLEFKDDFVLKETFKYLIFSNLFKKLDQNIFKNLFHILTLSLLKIDNSDHGNRDDDEKYQIMRNYAKVKFFPSSENKFLFSENEIKIDNNIYNSKSLIFEKLMIFYYKKSYYKELFKYFINHFIFDEKHIQNNNINEKNYKNILYIESFKIV